jgi:hypothetical protein
MLFSTSRTIIYLFRDAQNPPSYITYPCTRTYNVSKGGVNLDRLIFLMLACILAGFALIKVPLAYTFLASLKPVLTIIGVLAVILFSLYLIYKGLMALAGK